MNAEAQKVRNEIILRMSQQGYNQRQIADAVDVDQSHISKLLKLYRQSPETFFVNKYKGKSPKLTAGQIEKLKQLLDDGAQSNGFQGDIWTAARVKRLIKDHFDVDYHKHHIPKLLNRLGYSLQTPELSDRRKDSSKVADWLENRLPALKKKPRKNDG